MKLVTLLLLGGCLSLVQAQNPYLFFSPQAVVLSADAGTGTKVSAPVRMITTGPGFNFSVQGNQGWMAVAPTGGTIAAGGTFDMMVTCNPAMMQTGTYTGKITITPEASSGQLPASIDVSLSVQGVAILLNPSSLDLTLGAGVVHHHYLLRFEFRYFGARGRLPPGKPLLRRLGLPLHAFG